MSIDIKSLRSQSKADFSKLTAEIEKSSSGGGEKKDYSDDRFWKPERDKAGNASATIRFLPRAEGDELPWVKVFSHGFKGPGGRWYIENCPTTVEEKCPACELNNKLWNATDDDRSPERKQARDQKRRLNYIANILVIDDPKHPENNGRVFLFKFGKKIFDKIMDKARPTFEDEDPVNVFDYWEGANFKLRMKQVEGYPNYDTSVFSDVSTIGDDDEIVDIASKQYKLAEFIAPEQFKSYAELKTKLEQTMTGNVSESAASMNDDTPVQEPTPPKAKPAPAPKAKASPVDEDDDDVLSYFQGLADGD